MKKAKDHFLLEASGLGFLTSIISSNHEKTSPALVTMIDHEHCEAILPLDVSSETHIITHDGSSNAVRARKVAIVDDEAVDLFDLRQVPGSKSK